MNTLDEEPAHDEKVIPQSKLKVVLLIVGSGVFIALGGWMLSLASTEIPSQQRYGNPVVVYAIGIASIMFFGFCGAVGIKRLFSNKPGLILNRVGLLINPQSNDELRVPWKAISGFSIFVMHQQKMLVLLLHDPQQFIDERHPSKRALYRINNQLCGSPVAITSNTLQIGFHELLRICNVYLEKYGRT